MVDSVIRDCQQGVELGFSTYLMQAVVQGCLIMENSVGVRWGDNYGWPTAGRLWVVHSAIINNHENIVNRHRLTYVAEDDVLSVSHSILSKVDKDHPNNLVVENVEITRYWGIQLPSSFSKRQVDKIRAWLQSVFLSGRSLVYEPKDAHHNDYSQISHTILEHSRGMNMDCGFQPLGPILYPKLCSGQKVSWAIQRGDPFLLDIEALQRINPTTLLMDDFFWPNQISSTIDMIYSPICDNSEIKKEFVLRPAAVVRYSLIADEKYLELTIFHGEPLFWSIGKYTQNHTKMFIK